MLDIKLFFAFFSFFGSTKAVLETGLLDSAERIGERARGMNGIPPAVRATSREMRGDGVAPQRMEVAGDLSCGVLTSVDGRLELMVTILSEFGVGGGVG